MEGLVISYDPSHITLWLTEHLECPRRHRWFDRFYLGRKPFKIGEVVKVKITGAFVYDLMGEALE
jgi:hypothetical protein